MGTKKEKIYLPFGNKIGEDMEASGSKKEKIWEQNRKRDGNRMEICIIRVESWVNSAWRGATSISYWWYSLCLWKIWLLGPVQSLSWDNFQPKNHYQNLMLRGQIFPQIHMPWERLISLSKKRPKTVAVYYNCVERRARSKYNSSLEVQLKIPPGQY